MGPVGIPEFNTPRKYSTTNFSRLRYRHSSKGVPPPLLPIPVNGSCGDIPNLYPPTSTERRYLEAVPAHVERRDRAVAVRVRHLLRPHHAPAGVVAVHHPALGADEDEIAALVGGDGG